MKPSIAKLTFLAGLAALLFVASHNVPAQGLHNYSDSSLGWYYGSPHDSYQSYGHTMPSDSYVTPHVWGGGHTETYPGQGSITVNPDGFGGYSIHRRGHLPPSRW